MTRVNKRCKQSAASPQRGRCVAHRASASARTSRPAEPAGADFGRVAGAVLRSARRSARVSQARLAAVCGVTGNTIRAWESGSSPLASARMSQIEAVITNLHDAGACRLLTADLITASWCDLIISTVAATDDATSLLADPIVTEDAFGELMAWCLKGRVPERHRPYSPTGRLISDKTVIEKLRRILY
jgi:DNA-binding transcriptional regulator YiaG